MQRSNTDLAVRLLDKDDDTERADEHRERRSRIEQALTRLRNLYRWGDLDDDGYQRQRQAAERELSELSPRPRKPLVRPSVRCAGELLCDMGTLWSSSGVSNLRRRELAEEVFEKIERDRSGLRTVLPTPEYRPLFAVVGSGRGGGTLSGVSPPQVLGISEFLRKLAG